jgi:hypothetical protein
VKVELTHNGVNIDGKRYYKGDVIDITESQEKGLVNKYKPVKSAPAKPKAKAKKKAKEAVKGDNLPKGDAK